MGGIGVILNRKAGNKNGSSSFRGNIGSKLTFVLGDPDSLHETDSIEQIEHVINEFYRRKIDILGIGGGDGSNHYALDQLVKVYGNNPLPKVAFLCGGTHNAHALSVGVRGTPEKLLQNIMRKYHIRSAFKLTHRVLVCIEDGIRKHYGFSMAAGFMHRFYEELVQRQDDSPAKVAALLATWIGSYFVGGKRIREIFQLQPATLTVGNSQLDWQVTNGFSASGMEKLGLGFTPYPRASETPQTFQFGAFRISPSAFIRMLWSYKQGIIPTHQDSYTDITDQVIVETDQPISYVFDGELFTGTTSVKISTGPRIELICG